MTVADHLSANSGRWHLPIGARIVIGYEFCERIGFYSMVSLLALFLSADRSAGGFGWSSESALTLVGAYSGLAYAAPVAGGWAADRLLGHRFALALGGTLMFGGYVCLVFAAALAGKISSVEPVGLLTFAGTPGTPGVPDASWIALNFWAALCALVIGNALVKSTLVVALGDCFSETDTRRERAYAYYYAGINLGGLVAGFAAGSIASALGWSAAFAVSAFAMGIALGAYLSFGRQHHPASVTQSQRQTVEVGGKNHSNNAIPRLRILAIFAGLLLIYSIGSFQLWGTMLLFLERGVDRHVGFFEIPTPWFTSVESAALILAAPSFAALWAHLARRHREPDIVTKYALALALGAVGLFCFAATAWPSSAVEKPGWLLPAFGIVMEATGEVAAWTVTYGLVYRLAPKRLVASVMGAFYAATLGLGGYLAGWLGTFAGHWGDGRFFLTLALSTASAAVLVILIGPSLRAAALSNGVVLSPSSS